MTFFDISKKMLKSDFHRYRLYFLCNFFAVTLFFCFAAIFTNETFNNGTIVDPMISSNIFFPSVLVAIFVIFFLPFSYSVFLSSRKRDYGILLSLGMSRKDAWKNMLLEGFFVSAIALAGALGAGTILSFGFYFIISSWIGIVSLKWVFQLEPYILTILLYGSVTIVTVIVYSIRILKEKIRSMIVSPYRSDKRGLFCRVMKRLFPRYMQCHVPEWSFLVRHRIEWGIRYIIAALLIACVTIFSGMCIVIYQNSFRSVEDYAPYDMVYSQIFDQNNVSQEEICDVLSQYGVSVKEQIQTDYVRDNAFNYIPVSEANQIFGCDYRIASGEFMNLFQFELSDGYEHDITPVSQAVLQSDDNGSTTINSIGSDVKILFNQNPAFADCTLIVSDEDFELLQNSSYYWNGVMNLFRFEDWKTSSDGVAAVQSVLQAVNDLDDNDQLYYAATSKIEDYMTEKQSGMFLIFLICFVFGLLLMAEWLLIHFRIAAEREENQRSIGSLTRIGMTYEEQFRLIRFKNRMRFLPPVIAGTGISVFPAYWLDNKIYHSGLAGCFLSIVIGGIVLAVTILSISGYSGKELNDYVFKSI